MQKLAPNSAPFETSNAALAFALHKAGVPFVDNKRPCRNLYTRDILFTAGGGKKDESGRVIRPSRYAERVFGIELVAEVFAEGRGPKGLVLYAFQRVPNLGRLCKAYSAQEKECEAADFVGRDFEVETMRRIAAREIDEAEGLVRIACVDQKLRTKFMGMWRKMIPQIQLENPGAARKQETARGTVINHPGCTVAGINASEATRKRLKL